MSIKRAIVIKCDSCYEEFTGTDSLMYPEWTDVKEARALAARDGGWGRRGRKDVCPRCLEDLGGTIQQEESTEGN